MHFTRLPAPSSSITTSCDEDVLSWALSQVLGSRDLTFTHMTIIEGTGFSGRLLLQEPYEDAVQLDIPQHPDEMAQKLVELIPEARYVKNPPELKDMLRGWEVKRVFVHGLPAVLVWAVWVYKSKKPLSQN